MASPSIHRQKNGVFRLPGPLHSIGWTMVLLAGVLALGAMVVASEPGVDGGGAAASARLHAQQAGPAAVDAERRGLSDARQ